MDTKQSSPSITDSALRMPANFPELPTGVIERFPEMRNWLDEVNHFWSQNVNAVDDFARSVLDVTHIAGVLSVDPNTASMYIKQTRGAGKFADPDTPFYVDKQGNFSLGANLTWNGRTLTISGTGGGGGNVDWNKEVDNRPVYLTDGRIPAAVNAAGLVVTGVKPGINVSPGGVSGLYLGSDYLGYYNGANWMTYMDNFGQFFLGGPSGSLTWNGLQLEVRGSITATNGSIGGFTIGSDHIRDTINSFGLSSTVTGADDVRFWAGASYTNRGTAPFRVTEGGAVTATSGVIGGFTLATNSFTAGGMIISAGGSVRAGSIIGQNVFFDYSGFYQAANAGTNCFSVTLINSGNNCQLTLGGNSNGNTIVMNGGIGTIQAYNGSTSAPTYSFISDPDTGWRWNSSGDMRAVTNGADRLVVRDGAIVALVPIKLDNANAGASLTPTGYVTMLDSAGATVRLLTG